MYLFLAAIDPVAFSLGPIQIYWYGILMSTAALVGLWLAVREANRRGVDGELIIDMMIWVIPASIIGARLYYVFFQWDYYLLNPVSVFFIWEGGLAIHGGLIGAFLAGYIFLKVKKQNFFLIADIAAPSIIFGQAIGRWGNFVNQEAYGSEVSRSFLEGIFLPDWIIDQMYIHGTYYHPTFLYESLWNLTGFLLLIGVRRIRGIQQGEIFFSYLMWYSLGRFFIEGLRTDSLTFTGPGWLESLLSVIWTPMDLLFEAGSMEGGNIRIAQLMSLTLILIGLVCIILRRVKKWGAPYPPLVQAEGNPDQNENSKKPTEKVQVDSDEMKVDS